MSETIFLGLGSNLGDRAQALEQALSELSRKMVIQRVSHLYETDPWGYTDQPAFLNLALQADTDLEPDELLAFVKQIEVDLGRVPTFRYGPRKIDIDILLYGERTHFSQELTIPHPHLSERAFVLVPLAEIAPDWIHPVLHRTMIELLNAVDSSSVREWTASEAI